MPTLLQLTLYADELLLYFEFSANEFLALSLRLSGAHFNSLYLVYFSFGHDPYLKTRAAQYIKNYCHNIDKVCNIRSQSQ